MGWRFLGRRGRPWRNWSHNLSARPERVFHPKTLDDVVAIIHKARAEKKRIRVTGTSHSWAPLVPTDDFLVFTRELKGISVDLREVHSPRVTVSAGTTIAEFNEACRGNGFVFPTNVVPDDFTIVGVATAGCHGTGLRHSIVSDLVDAVELIDADGNLRSITARDGAEVLNAARLSLGLLGFVWRMTFRVVPSFHVRVIDDIDTTMESAIAVAEKTVPAHEYTQFEWWPFNERMFTKHYDRAPAPERRPAFCLRCWRQFVQRAKLIAGRGAYALLMLVPAVTPVLMRIMYAVANANADTVVPLEWAIHYQAGLDIVRSTNMEVAFPADAGFENFRHAWRVVVAKTREYQARGMYPFNVAMIARFVGGSSIPLSPAYGDGIICFIEIMTFADTKGWLEFSRDVMSEWIKIPNARPHWAKEARQLAPAAMRAAYGGDLERFTGVLDRFGFDRHFLFVNDYLESVFFPAKGGS